MQIKEFKRGGNAGSPYTEKSLDSIISNVKEMCAGINDSRLTLEIHRGHNEYTTSFYLYRNGSKYADGVVQSDKSVAFFNSYKSLIELN